MVSKKNIFVKKKYLDKILWFVDNSIVIRYKREEVAAVNMNLLRYFMGKNGDRQSDLAKALNIPQSALSARMNGKTDFRSSEMKIIWKRYSLNAEDMLAIFFAQ